jgi:hypothetical protein
MADHTANVPEPYRAGGPRIVADFHVDELAGDMAGAFSPFGQDVEVPLPLEKIDYVHPGPADRPHLAGT